ncbi:MAG: HAMP domain-containing histidine kinase [Paludibacteraceae bacterium]|nr:HAMP domain-containing histidine kinase [Paludibacteraceae bacterium]
MLILSMVLALLATIMHNQSPVKQPDTAHFMSVLHNYEKQARRNIDKLTTILQKDGISALNNYAVEKHDFPLYVFLGKELIFWTDNRYEVDAGCLQQKDSVAYHELSNTKVIRLCRQTDSITLVALIPLKNNFQYENDILQNEFASGFSIDKQIDVRPGNSEDVHAVFSVNGHYLCSLVAPDAKIYSRFWGITAFTLQAFTVLLLLLLFGNAGRFAKGGKLSVKQYVLLTLFVLLLLLLSLYYNSPRLLFYQPIFNPLQYAANSFLSSLGHLTLLTFFFVSAAYLFYFQTKSLVGEHVVWQYLFRSIFAVGFLLLYYIVSTLVFHSSIQINILSFEDISLPALWAHLLVLLWAIGLALIYDKLNKDNQEPFSWKYFLKFELPFMFLPILLYIWITPGYPGSFIVSLLVLWLVFHFTLFVPKRYSLPYSLFFRVFAFTLFFVLNTVWLNNQKNYKKYNLLAENILINGNTEYDRMTDVLLEELDEQLYNDDYLYQLASSADSVQVAAAYLNDTYLRGFWNKYEMRLNIAQSRSEIDYQYQLFIDRAGTKLGKTHFYRVPALYNDMTYLGIFQNVRPSGDTLFFYMEFYPGRDFKSYSFPNLLLNAAPDIQSSMGIYTARYEKGRLVYASDGFNIQATDEWIPSAAKRFYSLKHNGHNFFIYNPGHESKVVISEIEPRKVRDYLLYFAYTFLIFYLFVKLVSGISTVLRCRKVSKPGLAAKYQYMFVVLFIMSFLGIFYVSVNYIRAKYSNEQIAKLESKKKYIQKALQDMYYWNRDLSAVSTQALNFDLQELSIVYQTDIHVYDHRGQLVGSSQPLIFNKKLISQNIAPVPYFSGDSGLNQTEHIGRLEYLSGYAALYNGDYLPIGYISVPQFLSQEEMRAEIQEFLGVIVHIYLIIIILAVVLSIVIGRQLSAPLKMIENKLRQMRFGHRNEKIDYQMHDEIGQLVAQYNRTVDELERSAQLLARSERETAWKTMARQIAHEINNPLTPMKLTLQQLQRTHKMKDARFDDYFEKTSHTLIEQIDNLSRIAGTFSNFARMPEAQFTQVDVAARLKSVLQLFAHNHEQTQIKYEGPESGVVVLADAEQLTQVFNNLLKNAIQAIPAERNGQIMTSVKTEGSEAVFSISDNGTGIPDEVAAQLFTPNFTTKSNGMGLGLSISRNIVEIAGGRISFSTHNGKGTTFEVRLPLYG